MAFRHGNKRFRNVSGAQIGARAKKVWMCSNIKCGVTHQQPKKPECCIACGGFTFDLFHSTGECGRWNTLRLKEQQGLITGLRRQVSFSLYAARRIEGHLVEAKVGNYIADHVYDEDGERVVEDFKSSGVMDPLADWKLRHFEQQHGVPVKIVTE